ncbi:hypothetical protein [Aliarcobacter butzleri]|uniref:hypothetical protein n=1 Tax=Aliarcobacter butzleri TaxID=28197 RepID=UPI001269EE77|nr:hypothetical protein [Aliarcobacter butzleri]
MRKDIKDFLKSKEVTVELKGYKEMPSSDGYHMRGTLYVNGKKAIFCEDLGIGGEVDTMVLDNNNAKPLLDLLPELNKFKAYPGDKIVGDLSFDIEHLFVDLAENILLVKSAKKRVLAKLPYVNYQDKNEYSEFKTPMSAEFLKFMISKLEQTKHEFIEIFNFENEWINYSVSDLKHKLSLMK